MNHKIAAEKRRLAARKLRERLGEAEATIEAIRTGRVDAIVVSGAHGAQTRTIEGATHPYFVLLNAMGDGAALLDAGGGILFGNLSFGDIAGVPLDALRGTLFQDLVVPGERPGFEALLRARSKRQRARDFTLTTGTGAPKSVAIALSRLPVGTYKARANSRPRQSVVIMAIVMDLTYAKTSEAARALLLERLISAEDDERRRVARELHDETGQSLTALLVGLRTVGDMPVSPDARALVLRLRELVRQLVDDVGRLARGLHPAVLDDIGLEAAARRYVGDYSQLHGKQLDFVARDLDAGPIVPIVATTAYRILQEALTNVARHARAARIDVALVRDDGMLEVIVRDDGVGFDVTRTLEAASGLGLHGMRERVTLLGGSMDIESEPGQGTMVRAFMPADGRSAPPPPDAAARGKDARPQRAVPVRRRRDRD